MTQEMIISKIAGLSTTKVQYATALNAFVGNGFTSQAGNHYFYAVRFADGIVIKEDLGEGYKYTFLNGLKVYSIKDKTLIADAAYHNVVHSIELVKRKTKMMLLEKLREAAEQEGFSYSHTQAEQTVSRIVEEAFITDQRTMVNKQLNQLSS